MTPPRWSPGDSPTIPRLEAERLEIDANASLKVDPATGLELVKAAWGQLLRKIRRDPLWGKLSGTGPAYTFVEQEDGAAGAWAIGPATGTAREVNGRVGLDGRRALLRPDRFGDWRFQWIARGSAHAPPPCPVSFHFQDCDGGPLSGVEVRTYTPGTSIATTGTSDSGGDYTLPGTTGSLFFFVYDGLTTAPQPTPLPSVYFCDNPICYRYDHARVTVTYPAAASPTSLGPSGPDLSWRLDVAASSPGNAVFRKQIFVPCSAPSALPQAVRWVAGYLSPDDNPGYIPDCRTTTVHCKDDTTVDIPMFYYLDDYWGLFVSGARGLCDLGCDDYGEGPNHRGATPRLLTVTFQAQDGVPGFDPGDLAGVPIPVTWDGTCWDSGCLPNSAYYTFPYGPPVLCVGYSRVTICPSTTAPGSWSVCFKSYAPAPGNDAACAGPRGLFFPDHFDACPGVDTCILTAPVDHTGPFFTITE